MDIGIVVATEGELKEFISNSSFHFIKKEKYDVSIYEYENSKIYVIYSGVGEIASANATSYLILHYGIKLIINYGTAGALNPSLNVQDICVIDTLIDGDFDTSSVDNCEKYRHIELNLPRDIPLNLDNQSILESTNILEKYNIQKVKCFSSSRFIGTQEEKTKIYNETKADICEMEAIGIYLTRLKYSVPSIYLKGVSDSSNDENSIEERSQNSIGEEYKENISPVSIKLVNIIQDILKNL